MIQKWRRLGLYLPDMMRNTKCFHALCVVPSLPLDCKKGFFFHKIGLAKRKCLTRAKQASFTLPLGVWGERKKADYPFCIYIIRSNYFSQPRAIPIGSHPRLFPTVSASLPSHALPFSVPLPRSRPFGWMFKRTWIRKNWVRFAVYCAFQQCVIYT